jgi:hypothetical protein
MLGQEGRCLLLSPLALFDLPHVRGILQTNMLVHFDGLPHPLFLLVCDALFYYSMVTYNGYGLFICWEYIDMAISIHSLCCLLQHHVGSNFLSSYFYHQNIPMVL